MVKQEDGKWCAYKGGKKVGTFETEEDAKAAAGPDTDERYAEMRGLHLRGALGSPRTAMLQGREHLVVPVVALMEGVIHAVNADTPEFVSTATLVKAASTWNGRPVVLGHPVKDGRQCSANTPDVLESHGIGTIFNARVVGKKLLCEAWIDKTKAAQRDTKLLERLLAGQMEEVSVGAYVVTDNSAGNFNGKPFKAAWLDTTGDHLALLPSGRGACSIEMGCGAHRAASEAVDTVEWSHVELVDLLATLAKYPAMKMKDCEACGGTGSKDGNPCPVCDGAGSLKAAAAETLVVPEAKAPALKAACGCKEHSTMDPEKKIELVKNLIAHKHSGFTAGDEKMLEAASDERLESFRVAAEARANEEATLKAAAAKPMTTEEFMKAAPPELKALLDRQQQTETATKAALVSELKAAQGEYSETELSVMPVADLMRMARIAKIDTAKIDFSGRGIPRAASESKDDFTPPDPYAAQLKALRERAVN